jgi:glycosyltransferase involved in cell wall biosynthesis
MTRTEKYKNGISVIICCYNSEWIINETINAIVMQKNLDTIDWEVIIVNNACTDNTDKIVHNFISKYSNIDITLIHESMPGLIFARERGIKTSKYSHIIFCDDDNILCETYIKLVYDIMNKDPQIGACGGYGMPRFYNSSKPKWFDFYYQSYALGTQLDIFGNVRGNYLYGAGCCFSHEALDTLYQYGFKPILTGRCGNILAAGDDSELTKALMCIGYRLVANDNLKFSHVIHWKRLSLKYLLKMHEGFGYSSVILKLYDDILKGKKRVSKIRYYYERFILWILHYNYYLIRYFFDRKYKTVLSYLWGIYKGYVNWNYYFLYEKFQKLKEISDMTR